MKERKVKGKESRKEGNKIWGLGHWLVGDRLPRVDPFKRLSRPVYLLSVIAVDPPLTTMSMMCVL